MRAGGTGAAGAALRQALPLAKKGGIEYNEARRRRQRRIPKRLWFFGEKGDFMRTIIWFIYFWLYMIAVLPKLRKCKKLTAQGNIQASDAIMEVEVRKWARRLLKLAGVKLEISGLEQIPQGPAVYVGNHQGNFDIPLMLGYLPKPCGVLAKEELASLPFIRSWMELLHCVFVDRDNPRQAVTAINQAADLLRQGYSMLIFPEGTRSRGSQMGEFKGGAFKAASKTGVPIVPLCIEGSYKIMEANGFWIKPAQVKIKILPPVQTKDLDKEAMRQLEQTLRQTIEQEKAKL